MIDAPRNPANFCLKASIVAAYNTEPKSVQCFADLGSIHSRPFQEIHFVLVDLPPTPQVSRVLSNATNQRKEKSKLTLSLIRRLFCIRLCHLVEVQRRSICRSFSRFSIPSYR